MKIVTDLTDEQVAYWADEGGVRAQFNPPADNPYGMFVQAATVISGAGTSEWADMVVRTAWKPDEIDVAALARGGTVWLVCHGGLPPHRLEVQRPGVAAEQEAQHG